MRFNARAKLPSEIDSRRTDLSPFMIYPSHYTLRHLNIAKEKNVLHLVELDMHSAPTLIQGYSYKCHNGMYWRDEWISRL